jgi:hypothetical protein
MKRSGVLKEFNAAFKRRRMEATMRGDGFMTYATAMTRPPRRRSAPRRSTCATSRAARVYRAA